MILCDQLSDCSSSFATILSTDHFLRIFLLRLPEQPHILNVVVYTAQLRAFNSLRLIVIIYCRLRTIPVVTLPVATPQRAPDAGGTIDC